MPTVLRMPEVVTDSTEAVIQTWLVSVGQQVEVGEPLAEIETDKALVEYAAEAAGVLARLIAEPGVAILVGDPIAVVLAPGETDADIDSALLDAGATATKAALATAESDQPPSTPTVAETDQPSSRGRLFATPLVRKLAKERGINLATVTGTGPAGRIVRRDIDQLPVQEPASTDKPKPSDLAGNFVDIPLSGMRRAIARRLTESKTTVPHFYLTADCNVDALLELRRTVNASVTRKTSLNDFVLKAVAGALIEVPDANAIWNGDSIRRFETADIAVAVAVDGGLLTPVLRGVDSIPVSVVSARVADLAERARLGRIGQAELGGGSFSVSNLGMYGVSQFAAILNPPHSGILAVGAAAARPVAIDGELAVGTVMPVTLSADHRVIDGAIAARWMEAFVRRIENPLTILL